MNLKSTQKPNAKALLVGVQLPRVSDSDNLSSISELKRLVDTLGFTVVGQVSQKRPSISGATVVGEGKLKELAEWTGGAGFVASRVQVKKHKAAERFSNSEDAAPGGQSLRELLGEDYVDPNGEPADDSLVSGAEVGAENGTEDESDPATGGPPPGVKADVVVFDCDLSPSQLRNLESATGAEVLDRTGVIIEIFSRHARTRSAKLQVEIARLNYLAPRLRETGGGADRQGGGIGGKGAGESSQELDRRRIRDRVKELKDELERVQDEAQVRRQRRSDENCVALIGYTNAGKSSLMRAMTGSEILVADKLFATLDTTVRPMVPDAVPRVLISDTVGFIKKLPHDLVASFRSTLDEAFNADLLLYVVDASDPTFRAQLEVTRTVLREIGAGEAESRLLLNKRDRLTEAELAVLRTEFPEAIFLSTRDSQDLATLRQTLIEFFESNTIEEELLIPYNVPGAIGEVRSQMRVLEEAFTEEGVRVKVRARPEALGRLKKRLTRDDWRD